MYNKKLVATIFNHQNIYPILSSSLNLGSNLITSIIALSGTSLSFKSKLNGEGPKTQIPLEFIGSKRIVPSVASPNDHARGTPAYKLLECN